MGEFEVRYVGGFEAVEEGRISVRQGETIRVDEERAAHLIKGDAWELVGKRQPKPAPPGEEVSLAVPPGDVHESPNGEEEGS